MMYYKKKQKCSKLSDEMGLNKSALYGFYYPNQSETIDVN